MNRIKHFDRLEIRDFLAGGGKGRWAKLFQYMTQDFENARPGAAGQAAYLLESAKRFNHLSVLSLQEGDLELELCVLCLHLDHLIFLVLCRKTMSKQRNACKAAARLTLSCARSLATSTSNSC